MARRLGGVQRGVEFARVLLQGADVIAGRFQSEQARAFLVAPAMHADLAPEAPGAGVYALLLTLLGQRHGMPVAEGGTGAVSAALAAKLRDAGGVILTGRRVERIAVSGGRATGAEAGGELFEARRALIAAADPDLLVRDIINGSFAIDQQLVFRPGPAWWRWGSPLKGLYLASAAVPPGGGVHGACGDLAAAQALADRRRPLLLTGAAIGAGVLATRALRPRSR